MSIVRRGLCLVIAAPSGAGKSSVARALLETEPDLALSVSATTRAPRPGEQEGVHYFFRSQAEFDGMIDRGELIEWARVFGRSYGTPRQPVEDALAAGHDMVFDIDWQGHRQLRAALPEDVVSLFLLPPSMAALEARLRGRASDGPEEIARRMAEARAEVSHAAEFDHVLVNRDFDATVEEARALLRSARLATRRLSGLPGFLADLMAEPLHG